MNILRICIDLTNRKLKLKYYLNFLKCHRNFISTFQIKTPIYKNAYKYWDYVAIQDRIGEHTYGDICTKR